MKNRNGFTYSNIVLVALLVELSLIAMQFAYLKVYVMANEGAELAFTSDYMKTRGFYIFQIIGFFLYVFATYMLVGKIATKIFNKLGVLVIAGGIVELSFYFIIRAEYESAFLYSILDKVIAAAFGLIFYNYTAKKPKERDSYL